MLRKLRKPVPVMSYVHIGLVYILCCGGDKCRNSPNALDHVGCWDLVRFTCFVFSRVLITLVFRVLYICMMFVSVKLCIFFDFIVTL